MAKQKPLEELSPAYRRRIERGLARGLTRSQARGHREPSEYGRRKERAQREGFETPYQKQKQRALSFGYESVKERSHYRAIMVSRGLSRQDIAEVEALLGRLHVELANIKHEKGKIVVKLSEMLKLVNALGRSNYEDIMKSFYRGVE